jgi:hypothetical protein
MRFCWVVALVLATLCMGRPTPAQTTSPSSAPAQPASETKPYVLHVYANLVQVPVLALDTNFKPLPPLEASNIDVSLDSGPIFHPTKLHIEGGEPIALSIVLDASGDQESLLRKFADASETMAASSLRQHDRLTLFAVDCRIIRSSLNLSVQPHVLETAVNHALSAATLHDGKDRGKCGRSLRLWDTAAIAAKELTQQPGRRMLVIVSNGQDRKSTFSSIQLREFAADHSIAVFGLRDLDRYAGDVGTPFNRHVAGVYYSDRIKEENNYRELCEATGGLILTTPVSQLTASLARLLSMMRGRYILEFPRAANATPGRHSIDVTLPSRLAYIVVSGVTVAMPDADTEKDPTTIHTAPSPAVMGARRMLPETH